MNVYAIKAYENSYGGLHGINKHFLMAGDYKTAEEEGLIASHEVMESYSEFDSFYEEPRMKDWIQALRSSTNMLMNFKLKTLLMKFTNSTLQKKIIIKDIRNWKVNFIIILISF